MSILPILPQRAWGRAVWSYPGIKAAHKDLEAALEQFREIVGDLERRILSKEMMTW
jgi:hypothetical protein